MKRLALILVLFSASSAMAQYTPTTGNCTPSNSTACVVGCRNLVYAANHDWTSPPGFVTLQSVDCTQDYSGFGGAAYNCNCNIYIDPPNGESVCDSICPPVTIAQAGGVNHNIQIYYEYNVAGFTCAVAPQLSSCQ